MSYEIYAGVGGGGSIPSIGGGKVVPYALPIDDVLNNTVAFSLSIKDAPELDGPSQASMMQQAHTNVVQEANETNTLAEEIITRLDATSSKQYSTGDEAKSQIEKLREVISDMNELCEALNKFASYPIAQKANEYNTALDKLKDCVDLKLLKELADEINQCAKNQQNWNNIGLKQQYSKTITSSQSLGISAGEQSGGIEYVTTKYLGSTPVYTNGQQTDTKYTYEICKWRYVNYWGIINIGFWPFTIMDDDLPRLVRRFNEAGINPYNYI